MEFTSLGISAPILKALNDRSYKKPTPIQAQTIPCALEGKDILGLAQTGTGKTASFAIPILQKLADSKFDKNKRLIRSLILTPTRELAIQIDESFREYGKYLSLKTLVIYGGIGQGKQVSALQRGVDILVATPGRLLDLMNQGFISLKDIEIFTLDEADRMLDMGFIHDINKILKVLPQQKQTLLFSATMPKEIDQIAHELLHNPERISITPVSSTVDTVEQSVVYIDNNHKIDWIADFLRDKKKDSVLIFSRTKHGSDKIVRDLSHKNIKARAIHGNKSQNARQLALKEFKDLTTPILVATDIASRGIDINDLSYVINYDMPEVSETYVHRIGRTGRAGKSGKAISLVTFSDISLLKAIEKLIKKSIVEIANREYPMVDKTIKVKQQRNNPNQKRKTQETKGNVVADIHSKNPLSQKNPDKKHKSSRRQRPQRFKTADKS